MTTIHPHTDLAQLRVSGYYSGNGAESLLNCPTNTSFTMIVYPDGTNYLLVDSNNMAYTGRNVGSFEAPNIDWTNINLSLMHPLTFPQVQISQILKVALDFTMQPPKD